MLLILIFNTVVVVAQMLAAWLSRSLSVLSDAIHMAIDSVSYAANFYIEHRRATEGPTERLLKAELWVSVFSLVALVCSTAWVAYEAAQKLGARKAAAEGGGVDEKIMLWFAIFGLVVDFVSVAMFFVSCDRGRGKDNGGGGGGGGGPITVGAGGNSPVVEDGERDRGGDEDEDGCCAAGCCATGCAPRCKTIALSNVNILSAFVHIVCDTLRSFAVIAAAIIVAVGNRGAPGSAAAKAKREREAEKTDAIAALVVTGLVVLGAATLVVQIVKAVKTLRRRQDTSA